MSTKRGWKTCHYSIRVNIHNIDTLCFKNCLSFFLLLVTIIREGFEKRNNGKFKLIFMAEKSVWLTDLLNLRCLNIHLQLMYNNIVKETFPNNCWIIVLQQLQNLCNCCTTVVQMLQLLRTICAIVLHLGIYFKKLACLWVGHSVNKNFKQSENICERSEQAPRRG